MQLDSVEGGEAWKMKCESEEYDHALVRVCAS